MSTTNFSPFARDPWSGEGCIITGSYGNHLHLIDPIQERSIRIEAPIDGFFQGKSLHECETDDDALPPPPDVQQIDFSKKAIHVACHPYSTTVALAGLNQLFVYHGISNYNDNEQQIGKDTQNDQQGQVM